MHGERICHLPRFPGSSTDRRLPWWNGREMPIGPVAGKLVAIAAEIQARPFNFGGKRRRKDAVDAGSSSGPHDLAEQPPAHSQTSPMMPEGRSCRPMFYDPEINSRRAASTWAGC